MQHTSEIRIPYKILVGKPENKRPLGRYGRRWEANGKINLKRKRV
jgi:hypothetical protein